MYIVSYVLYYRTDDIATRMLSCVELGSYFAGTIYEIIAPPLESASVRHNHLEALYHIFDEIRHIYFVNETNKSSTMTPFDLYSRENGPHSQHYISEIHH